MVDRGPPRMRHWLRLCVAGPQVLQPIVMDFPTESAPCLNFAIFSFVELPGKKNRVYPRSTVPEEMVILDRIAFPTEFQNVVHGCQGPGAIILSSWMSFQCPPSMVSLPPVSHWNFEEDKKYRNVRRLSSAPGSQSRADMSQKWCCNDWFSADIRGHTL